MRQAGAGRALLGALAGLILWGAASAAGAQATGPNGLVMIPGRPWTSIIPDPDTYDWNSTNRPGYRFRGMTPTVKRFQDYINQKRAQGRALSEADEAYIRGLIMMRRWPEPPKPNPFWRAFMRYMRERTNDDLNIADRIMMGELVFRGFAVFDSEASPELANLINFLTQNKFTPDGWFQNNVLNGPAWMKEYLAATNFDLGPGEAGAYTIPKTPDYRSNARLTCNVSGAAIKSVADLGPSQRLIRGELRPGELTVAGRLDIKGVGVKSQLIATAWGGAHHKEQKLDLADAEGNGATVNYSVAIPMDLTMEGAGFRVQVQTTVDGYMGTQGLSVTGSFDKPAAQKAAEQAAGDAAWRQKVEETLRNLGHEETEDGKRVRKMREALAGGEAAWRDYVDSNLKEMGYSDDAAEFDRLVNAAATGGRAWCSYAGAQGVAAPDPSAVDTPTLEVGVRVENGKLIEPTAHFEDVRRVAALCRSSSVAPGTTLMGIWTLDGVENARAQTTAKENGLTPFSLSRKQSNLRDGDYVVSVMAGARVVGRRFFTIGGPGRTEETLDAARERRTQPVGPTPTTPSQPPTSSPPPTSFACTSTSSSTSVRLPLQPTPGDGQISLRLRYTKPGTLLDTVGLNAAGAGDYTATLTPQGKVQWMIYQPQVSSPVRQASGWHYLVSPAAVPSGSWHDVALTYGTRGMAILVDGQKVAGVASKLSLSTKPLYVGDFPGDDRWGPSHNIHPAFIGEIMGLSFSP